jgi:hypothetical protein
MTPRREARGPPQENPLLPPQRATTVTHCSHGVLELRRRGPNRRGGEAPQLACCPVPLPHLRHLRSVGPRQTTSRRGRPGGGEHCEGILPFEQEER